MSFAILALVVAHIADLYSTDLVLKNGGYELNPLMRGTTRNRIIFKMTHFIICLFIALALTVFGYGAVAIQSLYIIAVVTAIISAHNVRVYRQLKSKR